MKKRGLRDFLKLWASQSVSQLGSELTAYSLILWVYEIKRTVLSVSLLSFCSYVPRIIASLFAGSYVDRHSKKKIMLFSDSVAAVCSLAAAVLLRSGRLEVWHIYVINALIGVMNAFQSPASSVFLGLITPKEELTRASGMRSLAGNVISVLVPVIAGAIYPVFGLAPVIIADLCTFLFAFAVLAFFIPHEEDLSAGSEEVTSPFSGLKDAAAFLKGSTGILTMMLTMALVNFFSRLTYENILSPMILSRSGSYTVLSAVNTVIGIAGIAAGLLISLTGREPEPTAGIFLGCALSFFCGDLLMAFGRSALAWCIAGAVTSFPIPYIMSGQHSVMYNMVPKDLQGRVFALQAVVQYSSIPVGILLGGILADRVFEPFMASGSPAAAFLGRLVGAGPGSGMAVMFICTGLIGTLWSLAAYSSRGVRELRDTYRTL